MFTTRCEKCGTKIKDGDDLCYKCKAGINDRIDSIKLDEFCSCGAMGRFIGNKDKWKKTPFHHPYVTDGTYCFDCYHKQANTKIYSDRLPAKAKQWESLDAKTRAYYMLEWERLRMQFYGDSTFSIDKQIQLAWDEMNNIVHIDKKPLLNAKEG